jgi:hypothetical protein
VCVDLVAPAARPVGGEPPRRMPRGLLEDGEERLRGRMVGSEEPRLDLCTRRILVVLSPEETTRIDGLPRPGFTRSSL